MIDGTAAGGSVAVLKAKKTPQGSGFPYEVNMGSGAPSGTRTRDTLIKRQERTSRAQSMKEYISRRVMDVRRMSCALQARLARRCNGSIRAW